MSRVAFVGALLLDPEAVAPALGGLLVEAGRIVRSLARRSSRDARRVDLAGSGLAPGFLDALPRRAVLGAA
jgi:cytosine/adenosine deaminase-related metal-dependent hydrolase